MTKSKDNPKEKPVNPIEETRVPSAVHQRKYIQDIEKSVQSNIVPGIRREIEDTDKKTTSHKKKDNYV